MGFSNLVVADVVPGTEEFFEKLSFVPAGQPEHPLIIDGASIPLTRYEATIGNVLEITSEKLPDVE